MSIQSAFNKFMREDFQSSVDSSTQASWGGSGYSVELFHDGTYRVLWDNQIGNLYSTPGLILSIPALSGEEWGEDPSIRYYDSAEEFLRESFKEAIEAEREG